MNGIKMQNQESTRVFIDTFCMWYSSGGHNKTEHDKILQTDGSFL